jgi:Phage portal protein
VPAPRSKILTRATYARTPNSFLVNEPDGFPSDFPPALWWFGMDTGGGAYPIGPNGPWTVESAAAQPVVTRATALITGPLTAAPFRVVDADGQPLGASRWLVDPMLVRPDDRFGAFRWPDVARLVRSVFWTSWLRTAIWWGLSAFVYQLDQAGGPLAGTMRLINPLALSTTDETPADDDGPAGWHWQLGDGPVPAVFDKDGEINLGPITYRICVLRNPHSPIDEQGMSRGVFAMSPGAFRLAGQIDTYASGQFRGGIPNGYLKTSVPGIRQADADDLKAKWLAHHGGDRRSIAVLNSTTEFVPINLSPVDAALGEVKRLNVADVAFAFGLDPMTLGAGLNNSATYSNLRDAWENHRDFGLAPWIAAAQDTLSALMPGGQSVTVNMDGFANPTATERFTAYGVAIASGVLDVDEARALEGLPPRTTPPEPQTTTPATETTP